MSSKEMGQVKDLGCSSSSCIMLWAAVGGESAAVLVERLALEGTIKTRDDY
jgi:hypothetical protein